MAESTNTRLVWMDMEMTGLVPERDTILEIATLITDNELEILAHGPEIAIHQSDTVLAQMDDWNREHHGASGLTDRVRASTVSMEAAESATLDFLRAHCEAKVAPLCGNSIHQDRRFLARFMPALDAYLHYRMIDVSTVKELTKRWYPEMPQFEKVKAHRALDDIRESIAELTHYRTTIFK